MDGLVVGERLGGFECTCTCIPFDTLKRMFVVVGVRVVCLSGKATPFPSENIPQTNQMSSLYIRNGGVGETRHVL